ncbi:MAG: hypothetical protein E7Z96_09260 [Actinomycetaceae bacterium]|jgi:uncharacterized protein YukE|nr:hypothetical protein [Actinomycetaceae bacterium]
MVTWSDIQRWSSEAFEPTLNSLADARNDIMRAKDELESSDVGQNWRGAAANAAAAKRRQLIDDCESQIANIEELTAATRDAQRGTREVVMMAHQAEAMADHYGFAIADSGQVTDTPGGLAAAGLGGPQALNPLTNPHGPALVAERAKNMQETQGMVKHAIQKANAVDNNYAAALEKASQV